MRTHKYTTVKGLIGKTRQFSLYTFLNGRMYHNKNGWVNFTLSEKAHNEILNAFKAFLGLDYMKQYETHGIYERLVMDKDGRVSYIAGQDYPSEIRTLKRLLRC